MSSIASRASWGARYRNGVGNRRTGSLQKYFHHTVTAHLSVNATVAQERAQMRTIENIGQQRFGAGISYSFIIFPSGRIYEGASVNRIAYHSGPGRNTRGAGICLAGNYDTNQLGTRAFNAIVWLLQEGVRRGWWGDPALTERHRDFSSTACPGRYAAAQFAAINRAGRSGSTPPSGGSTPTVPEAPKEPVMSASDIWNSRPKPDYVNPKSPSRMAHRVSRSHEYSLSTWQRIRQAAWRTWLATGIWNRRIKPESSVANRYPSIRDDGYRASTWVQYAYAQARQAREQSEQNAIVLQELAKALEDVARGDGEHIYDAVAEAIAEHDQRQVQIDVSIAEAENADAEEADADAPDVDTLEDPDEED